MKKCVKYIKSHLHLYYYIPNKTDEAEIKRKNVSKESLGWWKLSDNKFANGSHDCTN